MDRVDRVGGVGVRGRRTSGVAGSGSVHGPVDVGVQRPAEATVAASGWRPGCVVQLARVGEQICRGIGPGPARPGPARPGPLRGPARGEERSGGVGRDPVAWLPTAARGGDGGWRSTSTSTAAYGVRLI